MNQLKETLEAKEGKSGRRQVEKDEDGIVFDRDTDGQKSNDWPGSAQNCRSKKRLSAETASKLAIRPETQGRRPDGRDEALNAHGGS